jgi:hypothetical protein
MAIGTWEPEKSPQIDLEKLTRLVGVTANIDFRNLSGTLPGEIIESDKWLMKCQAKDWKAAEGLNNDGLISLIRLFTLAEKQLPGWDGGKLSPVIYLVRILKQRSGFEAELRRWIKSNTDNRYLPNGAVL